MEVKITMARIVQLSPSIQPYHAVFYDENPDEGDDDPPIFFVDVPQFGIIERSSGAEAGPMIACASGMLVPAWTMDGYIACAPEDENDKEYWFDKWQEMQQESSKDKGKCKKGGKRRAEVKPESDEEEPEEPEEPEEEEEEEEAEGEVHLGGRKR